MSEYVNQTYRLRPDSIPAEVCSVIRGLCGHGVQAEVHSPLRGSRIDLASRASMVGFLEADSWVAGLLWHLIAAANERVWRFDITKLQIVQLTEYHQGSFFDWHKDTSEGPIRSEARPEWNGLTRKLSISLLLNDGEEFAGGDLQIKDEYGYIWKDPGFRQRGAAVVFPSSLLHQVTPVTSGCRYSAVAWALGPPLR